MPLCLLGSGIHEGDLAGVNNDYALPKFSMNDFFSGSFQQSFTDNFSHGFIGYKTAVRCLNELRYRLFKTNDNVVVLNDGSFIFEHYIDEALGISHFCSDDYVEETVTKLQKISDYAEKIGKKVVVIVTPSKADFVCDEIPYRYKVRRNADDYIRGYDKLITALDMTNICYFDAQAYLLRESTNYPVFCDNGIHWTRVAGEQAVERVIALLGQLGLKLNEISYEGMEIEDSPRRDSMNWDDDLLCMMNIISSPKCEYVYPVISKHSIDGAFTPNLFIQGGSFGYQILENFVKYDLCSDANMLFYNISMYDRNEEQRSIDSFEDDCVLSKVDSADLIFLEINVEAVHSMGSGFYDVLLKHLSECLDVENIKWYGFSQWEEYDGVRWRWAHSNDSEIVFSKEDNDYSSYLLTYWVPYDAIVSQNTGCNLPIKTKVLLNGSVIASNQCNKNEIFNVVVSNAMMKEGINSISVECEYSITSGEDQYTVQILNFGRNE